MSGLYEAQTRLAAIAKAATGAADIALDAQAHAILADLRRARPDNNEVQAGIEGDPGALERRIVLTGQAARRLEFGTRDTPTRPLLLPALMLALHPLRARLATALAQAFGEIPR